MSEVDLFELSPFDLEKKVLDKIKTIYDPEIPVNIHDLGLIYDIKITAENEVVVLMTLTAPSCPVAGGLPIEVENAIKELPEVKNAKVLLAFDPPWNPSLLSEEAKLVLGLL